MPKKVDEPQKKVEEEEKSKDFPRGICENVSRNKSDKELHMKRKHNDKTTQYIPSPHDRKVGYTWFACNSCKVKIPPKNKVKVHTNTVHASVKKIFPKEIPKRPIQCKNAENVIQHLTPGTN